MHLAAEHEGIVSITPDFTLPGGRAWKALRDPDGRWDEHARAAATPSATRNPAERSTAGARRIVKRESS